MAVWSWASALDVRLLLDTLANSGSSDVQEQAIRMLVETAPGKLHPGDIELLENTWYTLDDTMQSQLSRFLTTQHFEIGRASCRERV